MTPLALVGDEVRPVVAVLAPLYPPAYRGGGPIRSVEALVASAPAETKPVVLAGDRDLSCREPLAVRRNAWSRRKNIDVYYASFTSPRHLWTAMRRVRRLRPQMLHFNGLMNPATSIVPLLLWRIGFWGRATLLVAPRGELGHGAFGRHTRRKRTYLALLKLLRIDRSIIWHSTAPHETEDILRVWGSRALIVQRSNETLLPPRAQPPAPGHEGPIRVLFLGRLVEHKGLHVVLEALEHVSAPVELDVYGAEEDSGYLARCQRATRQLPAQVRVRYHGVVQPENVTSIMNGFDAFLLPTAGENFGHAIIESLSASCPVVTTPYTPWTQHLRDSGGGTVVKDRAPRSWTLAIDALATERPGDRQHRRVLAGQSFNTWASRSRDSHVWTAAFEAAGTRLR